MATNRIKVDFETLSGFGHTQVFEGDNLKIKEDGRTVKILNSDNEIVFISDLDKLRCIHHESIGIKK